MTTYERNSENDQYFCSIFLSANRQMGFKKSSQKDDQSKGYDYYLDSHDKNWKVDCKHCHGSYIVGKCTNGTININHPWRNSTESTHIYQGCFVMKSTRPLDHPIKPIAFYTKQQYQLQYIKDTQSIDDLVNELEQYLFEDFEFGNDEEMLAFFAPIIGPYLKKDTILVCEDSKIMMTTQDLFDDYFNMTGQVKEKEDCKLYKTENK